MTDDAAPQPESPQAPVSDGITSPPSEPIASAPSEPTSASAVEQSVPAPTQEAGQETAQVPTELVLNQGRATDAS